VIGPFAVRQRVAVGRRFGDEIRTDAAVRAGAILDDERLSERIAEFLARARPKYRRCARDVGTTDARAWRVILPCAAADSMAARSAAKRTFMNLARGNSGATGYHNAA